jgi:hypothetical protein
MMFCVKYKFIFCLFPTPLGAFEVNMKAYKNKVEYLKEGSHTGAPCSQSYQFPRPLETWLCLGAHTKIVTRS